MITARRRGRIVCASAGTVGALLAAATLAAPASASDDGRLAEGFPAPTAHTQQAYDVEEDFTSRWTRADALQVRALSDQTAAAGENSMPTELSMPEIPTTFPTMTDQEGEQVWVWDTWPMTDENSDQIAYNGWEIIFSLTADAQAGYAFDDRHSHARLGFFYREADVATEDRPENGGWIYGGNVFADGLSASIFEDQSYTSVTEWSGSTRFFDGGALKIFYTAVAHYPDDEDRSGCGSGGSGGYACDSLTDPRIVMTQAQLEADEDGVRITTADQVNELLVPDGIYYQTREQNPYLNFRDPFTFEDPAYPGQTFMVFEGNTAGDRGTVACTAEDLGYQDDEPLAEDPDDVTATGANLSMGNVGLAVAENEDLTSWRFLPPLLSANCVNDQTERPQVYLQDGKYYLFTISHRSTYARGTEVDTDETFYLDGPDGVYGFVGEGLRSDYQPLNSGSGLTLGNPTNLGFPVGTSAEPAEGQTAYPFQSYSHYVMPGGLVQSFIDAIGNPDVVRGGTLAPTVRLIIEGDTTAVDRSYGEDGLGAFGDIPANILVSDES